MLCVFYVCMYNSKESITMKATYYDVASIPELPAYAFIIYM